jgi:hypothetical protein
VVIDMTDENNTKEPVSENDGERTEPVAIATQQGYAGITHRAFPILAEAIPESIEGEEVTVSA